MSTLLITHPASMNHLNAPGHPERPDRLRAIESVLEQEQFQTLAREQAPAADLETVALCHPMDYVEAIREAAPKEGLVQLDADTSMSPGSFEAALRAVGGAVHAVDEVVTRKAAERVLRHAAARPPRRNGRGRWGSASSTRRRSRRAMPTSKHGLGRVAVVDFDVHHGNGTQDIFWSDPTLMYCSTHQMPLYPGTGAVSERGEHDNIVNAPLRRRRRRRAVHAPRWSSASCRG